MSLVALVNTTNHLFVRREPLILTQEQLWTCPWSRWLTQQTTYLYAENHLFQHRRNCEHVLGRVGWHNKPLICTQRTTYFNTGDPVWYWAPLTGGNIVWLCRFARVDETFCMPKFPVSNDGWMLVVSSLHCVLEDISKFRHHQRAHFGNELVCWSGTFSSLLNPFVFSFDGPVVGGRLQ